MNTLIKFLTNPTNSISGRIKEVVGWILLILVGLIMAFSVATYLMIGGFVLELIWWVITGKGLLLREK